MVEYLERAMRFKVAKFTDTATYTVTTSASPVYYTAATYTFTPGTSNNIILGIRLTAKVTTQGSFSHSAGRLRFQTPAEDVMAGETEVDFFSPTLYQQDGSKTNFQLPWVHASHGLSLANINYAEAQQQIMQWAGKESYVMIFEAARRDASDNISNIQVEIYYLTGTETKGAITKA